MPSPRRLRLLILATVIGAVIALVYLSSLDNPAARDKRTIQDFYHKTMNGMTKDPPPGQAILYDSGSGSSSDSRPQGAGDSDSGHFAADTKERLKAAEQKAKASANGKFLRPDPPSQIVGVGNSANGHAKKPKPADPVTADDPAAGAAAAAAPEPAPAAPEGNKVSPQQPLVESREEQEAEVELQSILKKAPVIIFSKTYCTFSKRAKGVLLEKYDITPKPYVVELDQHRLGKALQDKLKETTRRRTVPNIIINGVSLGGSDEILDLDNSGKLAAKIRDLGNKYVEISERLAAQRLRKA